MIDNPGGVFSWTLCAAGRAGKRSASSVSKLVLADLDEPIDTQIRTYGRTTVMFSWDNVNRPYNGKIASFKSSGYVTLYFLSNYPYGFTVCDDGKYYFYWNGQ